MKHKMKIEVFVLPQEIDLFEHTLIQLKRNQAKFPATDLDVFMCATLGLSSNLTNWDECKLPKEYFVEKFISFQRYLDWCENCSTIDDSGLIQGCVSKRREATKSLPQADVHLWLDCDMIFPDHTLFVIQESIKPLFLEGKEYFILTPEIVKIWDNTWDCITNENYKNMPLKYHLTCDIFSVVSDQSLLSKIQVKQISEFKFAGGWVTMLSDKLLQLVQIPEGLGHYGLEDMHVMQACYLLRSKGLDVYQYVMENLIVGENHRYRDDTYITNFLSINDKKDEYRQIAWKNFNAEFEKFVRRING